MTDYLHTMYRPEFESSACGIGFVARTDGQPTHQVVDWALRSAGCMKHRSGIDADGLSGDGAGILTQLPHKLLADAFADLPARGDYALGMLFLPTDPTVTEASIEIVNSVLRDEYNLSFHWREVPVKPEVLGKTARSTQPIIKQVIVHRPTNVAAGPDFERFLFMARKHIEVAGRKANLPEDFYIVSLSSETVVYKGLMLSPYLADFYYDLVDERYESAMALIHARYSTNTAPIWRRAQPMRMVAHNGEINTVQGNVNWMRARELTLVSDFWPEGLSDVSPIIDARGSDSSMLDNTLELITRAGRDIHHSVAMLAPEAWENIVELHPEHQAFYRYHAAMMEPWDGPAAIVFSDGHKVGATLDRNGLRPMRYTLTDDGIVVVASETGTVPLDEGKIIRKGKLGPGQMVMVDMDRQIFLANSEVKSELSRKNKYLSWISGFKPFPTETRPAYFSLQTNNHRPAPPKVNTTPLWLNRLQAAFGYTNEELTVMLRPMAEKGKEPTGSMGDDTAPAAASDQGRPLFNYFKQRFAQVTNPPIDPLRETMVMSLSMRLGARPNLLAETAQHAHLIELTSPVLSDADLVALKGLGDPRFETHKIAMRFPVEQGAEGLERALKRMCKMSEQAIEQGKTILILSDLGIDERHAPVPTLLGTAAVHHHLVRSGKRMQVSIVVETGEVREVHQLACTIGFGANAVNPYLALASVEHLVSTKKVKLPTKEAKLNFIRALEAGLLKIMSKMGISTVDSYCGAQIFEALGLHQDVIDQYFSGTVSRIGGVSLREIAAEVVRWHQAGYDNPQKPKIHSPGFYKPRKGGERHAYTPQMSKVLQKSLRMDGVLSADASAVMSYELGKFTPRSFVGDKFDDGYAAYGEFKQMLQETAGLIGPRDMFGFVQNGRQPISVDEVEPLEAIFSRFSTAAMSHGSLSSEVHENLAVGMNRIGATSNSGEGGSAKHRFDTERNDGIKQVASGRFGVTPAYLTSAHELQIKMAQGAKPGEGGQLPGFKVSAEIAAIRSTTPGTTLISPPPHHDIYSIEDLSQLIYDLKQVNPNAAVSVKLVSEAGVGTVAAGVVKGGADVVHIAGHSGGTGAAAWSSIKNVGLPWEMGLAEAQQTLMMNNLRDRVRVRTDGGIQTGRDIIIAAILGADEYSFGTAALVAEGCVMARACHNNTCPVGVATQQAKLRAKFAGEPEHLIAYMHYVATDVRQLLAELGFRSLGEIIGRTELLAQVATDTANADMLNLSPLLAKIEQDDYNPELRLVSRVPVNDLNQELVKQAQPALDSGEPVQISLPINTIDRTIGATLSGKLARKYGNKGLPEGTIDVTFNGSAGQSFGAFNANGITLRLVGEANDYVGKGMGGGQIVVRPPLKSRLAASDNVIIGNTCLYGATTGSLFAAGQAGERFAVRNSGATAVVEGVGDHGCEYMTGGVVVILGSAGYNFGAGMSGGVAFVLDEAHTLAQRLNTDMVQLARVTNQDDVALLRHLITRHVRLTGSTRGQAILDNWSRELGQFWKIAPQGTMGSTGKRPEMKVSIPTRELSSHVAA